MTSLQNVGFNLCMNIVSTFPPIYWTKQDYANKGYCEIIVDPDSNEYYDIESDVIEAQQSHPAVEKYENDEINEIRRIQNPYTYGRFMMQKLKLEKESGYVRQYRRYRLINRKKVHEAIKYNMDSRRLGKSLKEERFYAYIPVSRANQALLVVQTLVSGVVDEDDDLLCSCDTSYYIEYVVYFE